MAGDVKLKLPMVGETSDAAISMTASMAMEAGGAKKSPTARATVGAALQLLIHMAAVPILWLHRIRRCIVNNERASPR
jgi:hypothetical protein